MKQILISLFFLLVCGAVKAQVYVNGDINKDGKVSVSDVVNLVNMLNGVEAVKTPEAMIAGKWQTQDGELMDLKEDGSTDYLGANTFKYIANEKHLYLYDSSNEIVNLFNVVDINSTYIVLKALGEKDSKIFYNEFLIANPVVEVVHDTIVEYKTYEPTVGDAFEAIDLGLPSGKLWANMNLFANSPEETGYYYAWGEVDRKSSYTSSNYVARTFVDLATNTLGEGWKMPTKDEFQELKNYCVCTNDTINGIAGLKYTGFNGNSVFFPHNGYYNSNQIYYKSECVYPTTNVYQTDYIYVMHNNSVTDRYNIPNSSYVYTYNKYYGYNIRPIFIPQKDE